MSVNAELVKLLRCPITGQDLIPDGTNLVVTADGSHQYPVKDDIYFLLPDLDENQKVVQSFYNDFGWHKKQGKYCNTLAFVGKEEGAVRAYSRSCILSVKEILPPHGKFILDAGCGAIPHKEYLTFHEGFSKRICLDLSVRALQEAKGKLGNNGFYILGDLTRMPLKSNCVDAAVSCHAIYHVPKAKQADAFEELARVVRDGGIAVVVYSWSLAPLEYLIRVLALLFLKRRLAKFETHPTIYYYAHSFVWFLWQRWKFSFEIMPFCIIGSKFLAEYGHKEAVVNLLSSFQKRFPRFCACFGKHPIIIIKGRM